KTGDKVEVYEQNTKVGKEDVLIITNLRDVIKKIIKYPGNKFIFWQQGLEPEESFMRNHSSIRKKVLNFFELFTLRHARFIFFVSKEMRNYSELKHGIELKDKSYIMPCFNVEIVKENFFK